MVRRLPAWLCYVWDIRVNLSYMTNVSRTRSLPYGAQILKQTNSPACLVYIRSAKTNLIGPKTPGWDEDMRATPPNSLLQLPRRGILGLECGRRDTTARQSAGVWEDVLTRRSANTVLQWQRCNGMASASAGLYRGLAVRPKGRDSESLDLR
jgi:hypothetical protein